MAERYCNEAIRLLRAVGEEKYVADALVALGQLYQKRDQGPLAVACWQEAEVIYEAVQEAPQLAEVRRYLRVARDSQAN